LALFFKDKMLPTKEMKDSANDLLQVTHNLSAFLRRGIEFYAKDVHIQTYFGFELILIGYYEHEPMEFGMDTSSVPPCVPEIRNERLPHYVAGITDVGSYYLQQLTATMQAGLPTKTLVNIAAFIVQEAAKSDDRVGGLAQVAIITDGQPIQMLKQGEIENITKALIGISGKGALDQVMNKKLTGKR